MGLHELIRAFDVFRKKAGMEFDDMKQAINLLNKTNV
jgi:hypothetical protein